MDDVWHKNFCKELWQFSLIQHSHWYYYRHFLHYCFGGAAFHHLQLQTNFDLLVASGLMLRVRSWGRSSCFQMRLSCPIYSVTSRSLYGRNLFHVSDRTEYTPHLTRSNLAQCTVSLYGHWSDTSHRGYKCKPCSGQRLVTLNDLRRQKDRRGGG